MANRTHFALRLALATAEKLYYLPFWAHSPQRLKVLVQGRSPPASENDIHPLLSFPYKGLVERYGYRGDHRPGDCFLRVCFCFSPLVASSSALEKEEEIREWGRWMLAKGARTRLDGRVEI